MQFAREYFLADPGLADDQHLRLGIEHAAGAAAGPTRYYV